MRADPAGLILMILVLVFAAGCEYSLVLVGSPARDAGVDRSEMELMELEADNTCNEPRPEACFEFSSRLWPVATDVAGTCMDSRGNSHPSTGPDSATWFFYGGCGAVKEFATDPCTWVFIHATGDSCSGCILWHIDYVIEEKVGNDWIQMDAINPEPDVRGMEHRHCYLTQSGSFRIRAIDGFYVKIYER